MHGLKGYRLLRVVCAILFPALASADAPSAEAHLLTGARHFRAGAFSQALVEFRVAERLGAGAEATWYAGATLLKLGHSEDAVETFASASASLPAPDPLLGYYQAIACYESRLYHCADRLLAQVIDRSGPTVAGHAREIRGKIRDLLAQSPSPSAVQWYVDRARAALSGGRTSLAGAYLDEARTLSSREAGRTFEATISALERQLGPVAAETSN